ncbi:hypothetical protein F5X98DRAFT_365280 [Xylaria grammica]|nr:hypothetical protein F5X98DRAFT_365280 [Xylaria grammica]
MSATTGVNFVRFFFYAHNTISKPRKQALVALAYATARDQLLAPKEILIRADIHNNKEINNRGGQGLNGWHGTFAFKGSKEVESGFHVTTHGYTKGKDDFALREAAHSHAKMDSTPKQGGKIVWPSRDELEEYVDSPIAYSHLSR